MHQLQGKGMKANACPSYCMGRKERLELVSSSSTSSTSLEVVYVKIFFRLLKMVLFIGKALFYV
jgi:hypothetical protein